MKTIGTLAAGFFLAYILAVTAQHVRASDVAVMAMDAHMDMTVKRAMRAGDQARADAILAALKPVMQKYADVSVAQADGFQQFQPQLHLAQAHFTNWAYAREVWSGHFDPTHPTALMYRRAGNGWVLEGAMYTAPAGATQAQLDADVPLSIGQWHRHVNVCTGPQGSTMRDYLGPAAGFGLAGSIHDQPACAAAGGTWKAQLYGWMLHVWPGQSDPAKIWALHPHGEENAAAHMNMR